MTLFFAVWLMLSRLGDIKLGPDHSEPEYSYVSWFAMLFSAGMGIGLLFFGVAEPIMHFTAPPTGDPNSLESAREALKITFFHWGLHAWAIYAVFAVILAYFSYRKDLPLLPRSAFHPFIGDKIYGPIGDAIDIFSIIGTLFGVATSLGFGVTQVNAGLSYLTGLPQTPIIQVGLIAIITMLATFSVVLGLDGGIKRLSNLNMILAVLLLFVIMMLNDPMDLMRSYTQNTGSYLSDLVYKTFNLYNYEKKTEWIGGWTLLYWGWWVSWTPFVGMFIARISRGRTIREFMTGILLVPPAFTFLWMTVFGNSAINIALTHENGNELVAAVSENVPVALFKFFEFMPFSSVLSVLGLMLVTTFFVSSSDSGSLVIDTLASGGAKEPPVWQRIYWAVLEGLVAAILLLAGGLDALQTMTIASAFPMIFILIIGCVALVKSLKQDYMLMSTLQNHNTVVQYAKADTSWRERLNTLTQHPSYKEMSGFLKLQVLPALQELETEFKTRGYKCEVLFKEKESSRINILSEEDEEKVIFSYGVRLRSVGLPEYANENLENPDDDYYRAEVFLISGGQHYDIRGYTKEQIIADAVTHYEKHLHYLHLHNPDYIEG